MGALPKIAVAPHPSHYSETREYMREQVMAFIQGDSTDPHDDKAWIHVIDPSTITSTLNVDTGVMTVSAYPVWSGYARIQPIRNSVTTWRATNPTSTRIVQFWVDFPDRQVIDFKPGLRIAVERGGNDPWLTEYQYTVVGALNSTQAWQRTVDTQVDLENRPNYDMSTWPKPGD